MPSYAHAPPRLSDIVFLSAHHATLVAAFLSVDELLLASSLSHFLHAIVDGEAVWRERLSAVQAIPVAPRLRFVRPSHLSFRDDSMPPLPSRAAAASLCVQAYREVERSRGSLPSRVLHSLHAAWLLPRQLTSAQSIQLVSLVEVPYTVHYHARFIVPSRKTVALLPPYELNAAELTVEPTEGGCGWEVIRVIDRSSEFQCVQFDNRTVDPALPSGRGVEQMEGEEEEQYTDEEDEQEDRGEEQDGDEADEEADEGEGEQQADGSFAASHALSAPTVSSKQWYIELMRCCAYRPCERLLSPARRGFVAPTACGPLGSPYFCTSCEVAYRADEDRTTAVGRTCKRLIVVLAMPFSWLQRLAATRVGRAVWRAVKAVCARAVLPCRWLAWLAHTRLAQALWRGARAVYTHTVQPVVDWVERQRYRRLGKRVLWPAGKLLFACMWATPLYSDCRRLRDWDHPYAPAVYVLFCVLAGASVLLHLTGAQACRGRVTADLLKGIFLIAFVPVLLLGAHRTEEAGSAVEQE